MGYIYKIENLVNGNYAEIVAMLREYEAETGRADGSLDKLLSDTRRLEDLAAFAGCPNIYASAARIILDLREKMDKKSAGAGRLNVCKRMAKESPRFDLSGILEQDGRFCITDSYRVFRFADDLPSIRRMQGTFNFRDLFKPNSFSCETLPPVSRAAIKEYIAVTGQTRKKPKAPFFLLDWYAVNPFYLLDVLDAMPDAVFHMPKSYCDMLYFEDGAGNDGILCPVRHKKALAAWEERKKAGAA